MKEGEKVYIIALVFMHYLACVLNFIFSTCSLNFAEDAHTAYQVKALIIRPNTTYKSSTIVFYCALQHISAVQISHQLVDVGYTKSNMQGERPIFTVMI